MVYSSYQDLIDTCTYLNEQFNRDAVCLSLCKLGESETAKLSLHLYVYSDVLVARESDSNCYILKKLHTVEVNGKKYDFLAREHVYWMFYGVEKGRLRVSASSADGRTYNRPDANVNELANRVNGDKNAMSYLLSIQDAVKIIGDLYSSPSHKLPVSMIRWFSNHRFIDFTSLTV